MIDSNTQRRLVYLFLFVAVSVPLIVTIEIPLSIPQETIDAYNTIESMPDGSIALIDVDFSTHSAPECSPQLYAFLKHAIRKNFKFVITTFKSPDAILYAKNHLAELDLSGYTYGEDYVQLGFYPGGETSLASFARDIHGLVKTDIDGIPIDELPLMQNLRDANDFDIYLVAYYNPKPFAEQINAPYGSIVVVGGTSHNYLSSYSYYLAGQFKGVLNGAKGGAAYETLMNYSGKATAIMNIMSFSHIYILGAIIIGNIIYWKGRTGKK